MATLDSLEPAEIALNSPDTVLRCLGSGFAPSSIISFAGNAEPTTFVSETEVTTGITPSLPWGEVTVEVTVDDSAPLGFTFTAAQQPQDPGWLLEELKVGNIEALTAASDDEIATIKFEYEAWAEATAKEAKERHAHVMNAIVAEMARRGIPT